MTQATSVVMLQATATRPACRGAAGIILASLMESKRYYKIHLTHTICFTLIKYLFIQTTTNKTTFGQQYELIALIAKVVKSVDKQ